MMLRRTTSVLFASLLLAGGVAASAHAAPAKPKPVAAHAMPKKATMARSTHRAMPMTRGGDAQNSAVDQLNAQSLQNATSGATTGATTGAMPAGTPTR